MAETTPPRRRPFMNGLGDSQPRGTAVLSPAMHGGMIFAAAAIGVAATAAPVKIERDSKALEFSYEWPAAAAAVPALDRKFRGELDKGYKDALANAREDQKLAREQKRDFNGHYYSVQWTTAGETARLLSLQSEFGSFEGGAHPNTSYDALLWDRKLGKQIAIGALLTGRRNFAALTRTAYCKALDAERDKRREGEKLDLPEFNACPKFSDLAIAPVDKDKDGRLDAIDFVASPYVAGPYAEGEYELELPVTSRLISALKPEYRSSFEVQRQ